MWCRENRVLRRGLSEAGYSLYCALLRTGVFTKRQFYTWWYKMSRESQRRFKKLLSEQYKLSRHTRAYVLFYQAHLQGAVSRSLFNQWWQSLHEESQWSIALLWLAFIRDGCPGVKLLPDGPRFIRLPLDPLAPPLEL